MFARDAGMAEAWLCSQEPLVRSAELGCTVDEVESLIKRHEAFQKSAVAWEERFSALEKLTAVRDGGGHPPAALGQRGAERSHRSFPGRCLKVPPLSGFSFCPLGSSLCVLPMSATFLLFPVPHFS